MNIKVISLETGIETITLKNPVVAQESMFFHRLKSADGTEYYFQTDGYYDGSLTAEDRSAELKADVQVELLRSE